MSKCSEIRITYTKSGLEKFVIEISHEELNKYKLIKGDDAHVVKRKALVEMDHWDEMWEKQLEKQRKALEREQKAQAIEDKNKVAGEKTEQARAELARLDGILEYTLDIDDTVDWEQLKVKTDYPVPQPEKPKVPPKPQSPDIPSEPKRTDQAYQPKLSIIDKIIPSKKQVKLYDAAKRFKHDHDTWLKNREAELERVKKEIEAYKKTIKELQEQYIAVANKWMVERKKFLQERDQSNAAIDKKKEKYLSGDLSSVMDYCDIVLTNSNYPDYFPKTYELDYNPENKIIIVDYQLPSPDVIPTVTEVKYVQARDEYQEKNISQSQLNKLYDSVLYQIGLRTIHELYEADVINGLQSVVFNGYVTSIDPATGQKATSCVFSVQANKEEFRQINLANINPKACFKKLRGVSSSKLHSLTPIAPILQIDKDDRRFVSSYDVTSELDDNYNLAAMDWEDFEHLIRELFEKEFSAAGGEVKVTQASRDGGIDAVAFDPDPIRGGKIVIQAKRYTNTVGVSAVRDLYGTVMNEGANKGILVTTADYGPDAYSFAKGKPLTLLSGSNLLHLLDKHGHSFKIDLKEAKKILADKENDK